ncbi:MAG: glycoside hydrolase family 9 protein [Lachnospiraceae bacterium]|nr:glycoside hydrolase family 9 protein [Lachnospiraceae bacterium]
MKIINIKYAKIISALLIVSCIICGCDPAVYVPLQKTSAEDTSSQITEAAPDKEPEDVQNDAPPDDEVLEQLIPGGDFSETNSFWGIYTESGGSANFGISGGKMEVKISDPGKVGHAVQLYCDGFKLDQGVTYAFSAEISSDVKRTIEWRIQLNGGDYHPYIDIEGLETGPDTQTISCEFTMEESSDPAPRMCFNLGDEGRAQQLSAHSIYLDNVSLIIKDDSNMIKEDNMSKAVDVNINQIGYRPGDEKRAVIRDINKNDDHFEVIDTKDNSCVFEGDITNGARGGSSGDIVGYADFSALTKPGTYKVKTPNSGDSFEFTISEDVYAKAFTDSLRMLYLQRCGTALPESLAGDFAHDVCHTELAKIYGTDKYIEVSGGWHDAGDYGRYTVPAAKTIADLLIAYEMYPDAFDFSADIPESGNGMPDVLNEAKYELDWLFKMQSDDGGIYHKVTGLNFDGFVNPDECTEELYVLPTSKTATADFAAVMYMASRVYGRFDSEYADKCKKAADRALASYYIHKDERNYTNPPDVNTGEYADGCSVDELLWAICEGYKTTGDQKFSKMLETVDMSRITADGFGWDNMSGYAYYAYLTSKEQPETDKDLKGRFYELVNKCRDLAISGEAYGATIKDEYPWGSNMTIANNGMALLMAYSLTKEEDYRLAAKRQLDYLLGVNCNSYCFLTGYGTLSPQRPHHRPSQAVGKCMKGMLVGGPDSGLHDPYAKTVLAGLPKARCYTDNEQSYSCNEITIYWNSPLCALFAGLSR